MTKVFYFIFAAGLLLEFVLLWRIQKDRMWRSYVLLSIYLYYVLGRTLVLFGMRQINSPAYASLYWRTEPIAIMLRFLIVWEVFRHSLGNLGTIRRIILKGSLVVLVAITLAFFLAGGGTGTSYYEMPSLYFALESRASLAQAALLAGLLLAVRYYGIRLSRNVWGLAVGLGVYVSISSANFAAFELRRSFYPFWQHIRPLSFVAMLAVWTWSLWNYSPNPGLAPVAGHDSEHFLAQWREAWDRMLTLLRKVFEP